jgi:hypothetical protein
MFIEDDRMFNWYLRKKLKILYGPTPGRAAKKPEFSSAKCGSFFVDQGDTETCYIVSVITFLHNEQDILKLLHHAAKENNSSHPIEALNEMLRMLDLRPNQSLKTCPLVPQFMRDVSRNRLTMKTGSVYLTLLYILNMLKIYGGHQVKFIPNIDVLDVGKIISYLSKHDGMEIVAISLNPGIPIREVFEFIKKVWVPAGKRNVRGFFVSAGKHVSSVNVCHQKTRSRIFVCDSDGQKCKTLGASARKHGSYICDSVIAICHFKKYSVATPTEK